MVGGRSTSAGIVFYDTEKAGDNAVFCFFDGEAEAFETGEKESLLKKLSDIDEPRKVKGEHGSIKIFFSAVLFAVFVIAAVWIFIGGFFPVFGAFLFAALGFVPGVMFIIMAQKKYADEKDFLQFKRFHGAEHMILNSHARNSVPKEFSEVKKASPYDPECGTAYGGTLFFFAAVAGISFGLVPKIGFLWFLGITVAAAILLFFNFLNPHSPFMILQRAVVEKPSEKELHLAYSGFKKLFE